MDYFDLNMELLRKRQPLLAKRLEEVIPAQNIDVTSLSATPIIDPKINLSYINTLAVLGFGMGTHVRELVERTQEKTLVLVVDPDIATFKALLKIIDLTPILKRPNVKLAIGEFAPYAVRSRIDNYYKINTIPDITVAEHKPSLAKNPLYYEEVKTLLEEATVVGRQNLATLAENATLWQNQILINLPIIIKCPGLRTLYGRFQNMPVIIVAAGPSLDKNVMHLKEAKDKAVIICVDTALRTLFNHNIKPDLVITIDATAKNYNYYLKDLDISDIYLIAGPAVYPETFLSAISKIFVSSFGHPLLDWIETFIGVKGTIKLGGSVSTAAFDLARRGAANPIIFIGQDLGFPDDKVYTSGVKKERFEEAEKIWPTVEFMWVEDVYGGKVKTVQGMWTWIKWFEHQISEMPQTLCIDATEGGAKIPGTKILTLKETIEKYCQKSINIDQILQQAYNSYVLPDMNNLLNEMERIIKDWKKVQFIGKEGTALANRLLETIADNHIDKKAMKMFKELGILYHRIIENHRGFMRLSSWNLESLLFRMERFSLSTDPVVKATACKNFFEEISTYCQETVISLTSVQEKLFQIQSERKNNA
ncbi:MAG: 6-hydroxymethylpterin diphosphokinase MptE-like protein [bacterium]